MKLQQIKCIHTYKYINIKKYILKYLHRLLVKQLIKLENTKNSKQKTFSTLVGGQTVCVVFCAHCSICAGAVNKIYVRIAEDEDSCRLR